MSHNRNPKPPYPPQFRQQMVELVAAGRKPSAMVCRQKRSDVHAIYTLE